MAWNMEIVGEAAASYRNRAKRVVNKARSFPLTNSPKWWNRQRDYMNEIRFTIPSTPPSVNSLYNVIFSLKRVEMKPECRMWSSKAITYMPPFKPETINTGLLRADVTFHYPMYYKEGKLKKKDASNMLKLLIDAISNRYGIDDKFVTEGSFKAVDSENEKTEVTLSVL